MLLFQTKYKKINLANVTKNNCPVNFNLLFTCGCCCCCCVFVCFGVWPDVLFTFILYLEYTIAKNDNSDDMDELYDLWLISITFLIFPYIFQCVVCLNITMKWYRSNAKRMIHPVRIHDYLKSYILFIYGLTIISGFYGSIALLRSKFFYFDFFWIPLKTNELKILKSLRFINIVLLESIPQLMCQIFYLFTKSLSDNNDINSIVFISMTFSVIGIIFSFMTELSHIIEFFKPREGKYNNEIIIDTNFNIETSELTLIQSFVYDKIDTCFKATFENCRNANVVEWLESSNNMSLDVETYYIRNQIASLKNITVYSEITLLFDDKTIGTTTTAPTTSTTATTATTDKDITIVGDKANTHAIQLFANKVRQSIENFGIITTIENEKFVESVMNTLGFKDKSKFKLQGFMNNVLKDKNGNEINDLLHMEMNNIANEGQLPIDEYPATTSRHTSHGGDGNNVRGIGQRFQSVQSDTEADSIPNSPTQLSVKQPDMSRSAAIHSLNDAK